MSLTRQLWLAVTVVMLLAFSGTFLLSTLAARSYFAQELAVKNNDNAQALALSISQIEKDMVTLELLVSAQFDTGHYRLIQLVDPDGKVMIEQRNDALNFEAPAWFASTFEIKVPPGVAQIQDGWSQFGTLRVESNEGYAYDGLWSSTMQLLMWFFGAAILACIVGSLLLRVILRPLDRVVDQAEAMGRRQFITQQEPRTVEFRQVVRAMNQLSNRVEQMLQEQSRRVDTLRKQIQTDALTGLSNRDTFVAALEGVLGTDDHRGSGVVVVLRLQGLAELNNQIGREGTDNMLKRVANSLAESTREHAGLWTLARVSPSEFAVVAPAETDAEQVARQLASAADLVIDPAETGETVQRLTACANYQSGESRGALMTRLDSALGQAEAAAGNVIRAQDLDASDSLPTSLEAWRKTLEESLEQHGVRLGRFTVASAAGTLMHHESPVRLRIGDDWVPAARFLAWAARLGLMPKLDEKVITSALENIEQTPSGLSVVVSPESFSDPGFVERLETKLTLSPSLANKLWLEAAEHGALRHLDAFREFCTRIKPLGCRLGLKHAGQQFSRIAEFHGLGLDYFKIDGSIIRGVNSADGPQSVFLRSLCTVCQAIDLSPIATGVTRPDMIAVLTEIGVDGFTGPGVAEPRD